VKAEELAVRVDGGKVLAEMPALSAGVIVVTTAK
jgi:hypothetical protein